MFFFSWFQKRQKPLGTQGEDAAVRYLKREGFQIRDRNVRLGRYEVDIIAQEGDTIVFVEVKTRRSNDFLSPENNVNWTKKKHLINASRYYLMKQKTQLINLRFDIVSVVMPEKGKISITLFRNAFQMDRL